MSRRTRGGNKTVTPTRRGVTSGDRQLGDRRVLSTLEGAFLMNRTHSLGLLAGAVIAATTVYACSGDDNSTPPPPVNDAGPVVDGATIPATDGGDAAMMVTPDGSTPPA